MSVHYFEFDSTYRNRNEFPYPAKFQILMSESALGTALTAKDPVSDASPILYWNSSFEESFASTVIPISSITLGTFGGDTNTFLITGSTNFKTATNFYTGAVLYIKDAAGVEVWTRITYFKLMTATTAKVSVLNSLPSDFPKLPLLSGTITNPTNDTSTSLVPQIFIPTGFGGDNFYNNYYVQYYNPTSATPLVDTGDGSGTSFLISSYDATTRLATLSDNTAVSWNLSNGLFQLRKALPISSGNLVYPTLNPTITNTVQLDFSTSSPDYNKYAGSFFRLLTPFPSTVTGLSVNQDSSASETKIAKYITGNGTIVSAPIGTNTFTLTSSTSSFDDDYYTGGILTLDFGGANQESLTILTYNGTTHSGTVSANWGIAHVAGEVWQMASIILQNSITISPVQAPQTRNIYEIENFSRDNCNPFLYTGSLTSVSETVCYEIELINLILPNSTISSGRGGRAIFYPYLYVELKQLSSSSSNTSRVIYSNNPNSAKCLFRAVVNDTTQPVYSPFIKIDGNGMTHTIKFKPTDGFLMSVYTPSGELFQLATPDFYSPKETLPTVQISACFAFKRLQN